MLGDGVLGVVLHHFVERCELLGPQVVLTPTVSHHLKVLYILFMPDRDGKVPRGALAAADEEGAHGFGEEHLLRLMPTGVLLIPAWEDDAEVILGHKAFTALHLCFEPVIISS